MTETETATKSNEQLLTEQITHLQEQLFRAQKMASVGALASSITHEFNNILTTILNYARMGTRKKDDAVRDKAFDKILAAAQRAAKITTGVLAFARSGKLEATPTSLARVVEETMVLAEKDLQVHRISVTNDLDPEATASINVPQVQQVLLNLVINARQAMQPGGRLTLSTRRGEDGMVELAVADSGRGIPHEELPKIFEPFFSTKEADDEGRGGSGLGLAFCREIIEAHGGRIRVESAIGQGTTFTLRFPPAEAFVEV